MTLRRLPFPLSIRAMQKGDLDAVLHIDQLSFSTPWSRHSFQFEVEENRLAHNWVAELRLPGQNPVVVGATVIWLILDEAHIGTLAVHPSYRQMGIARQLLAAALDALKPKGAETVLLEARRSNHAALHLYESFGFQIVGERPAYYQDGEDAVLMTAWLSATRE